jgi:hypothetical protein
MDALDALSTEHPVLSTRTRRRRERAAPVDRKRSLDVARRLAAQLPTLVRGGWSPPVPVGRDEAALRLYAAVWALAARRQVLVGAAASAADVARKLRACGVLVPPAADAVAVLEPMLADGSPVDDLELCRVAARVTAYIELRAGFG